MFAENLGASKGQNYGAVASFAFTTPFGFVCLESNSLAFSEDTDWLGLLWHGWAFLCVM